MIPMLTLTGTVMGVHRSDEGINKKGEKYGGKWVVQLLGERPLRDSEDDALKLQDLSTEYPDYFKQRRGDKVSLPVEAMNGQTQPVFFISKGWNPFDPPILVSSDPTPTA